MSEGGVLCGEVVEVGVVVVLVDSTGQPPSTDT